MNSDGSERKQITQNTFWDGRPVWSQTGKKLLLNASAKKMATGKFASSIPMAHRNFLTQNAIGDWEPYWLPDGHTFYMFHGEMETMISILLT